MVVGISVSLVQSLLLAARRVRAVYGFEANKPFARHSLAILAAWADAETNLPRLG